MITRRLARSASSVAPRRVPAPGTSRTFGTSTSLGRTPSLADVEPDNHEDFNRRQKAFREEMVQAQKQREASASRSLPTRTSSHYPTSGAVGAAALGQGGGSVEAAGTGKGVLPGLLQGLGSLSTATTGRAAEAAANEPERKQGPLSNLIYGTKEGREMDAQIEASFSAVLARGKYMHSIVMHEVKPDCVDEYVDLVGKWYPRMAEIPDNKVHLVGSWRTEVGDCDTFGKLLSLHSASADSYSGSHVLPPPSSMVH